MRDYNPMLSFGAEVAALYDEPRGDETDAVRFLARRAGDGRALELAVGTGRIALPLAAAGVAVEHIDLSEAMVARLRSKPGGEALSVTIGDFVDVPVEGSYRLVYIVDNTLFNLLTQDDQMRCVENVAAQLQEESHVAITPGGVRLHPIVTRYIWPSELDLMARIAGLRLVDRFGGWNDEPFTHDSRLHVSVYGR